MNRMIKKISILFGIFAVVLLIYLVGNREWLNQGRTTYTAFEEARLPVVYVDMFGQEMNPMYGYRQDMGNAVARDSLTILPENRNLSLHITGGREAVLGIRYEIRSLDLSRLVEDTRLESWETGEDGIRVKLPIQNLLAEGREYLLRLELETEGMGQVFYYTRIMWTTDEKAQPMIQLATDFASKTFHYEQAQELVTYMEPNTSEDNSSYGHTCIHSSFSHLTWGGLKMEQAGEIQVTLKELDGLMGCVSLAYLASREGQDGTELYQVEENFTMKWNETRTYLMDYERTVDQIFDGNRNAYLGKRIMLGITNDDRVEAKASPDGNVIAYRANRDLWSYDQEERHGTQIFSFRGNNNRDMRNNYNQHEIRILRAEDNGDIYFLVYGYQNRGNHEGRFGIVGYQFEKENNAIQELFFIPVSVSFGQLEEDLGLLSYQSASNMLYLYLDHAVYGIDMKSNETMVVADALEEGSFAVSVDKARLAWQENGKCFEASVLHLLDLETGEKQDIRGENQEYVRTLGFVGRDLVYGISRAGQQWVANGRLQGFPMYAVEIINDEMQVETRYEKEGYYVDGVTVDESRIHLQRMAKTGDQSYAMVQEDTIVCNVEVGTGKLDGIGWFASQERGRIYFVQLSKEIRGGRGIRTGTPGRVGTDAFGILNLQSNFQFQGLRFYAYGGGRLLGVTTDFSQAVALAYERMGIVADQNQQILWGRVNRSNTRGIRDPLVSFAAVERHLDSFFGSRSYNDGVTVLDARGCTLPQMLYFIDQGIPVVGYTGEGSYLLLCGYDNYNITVYDPVSRETYKEGLNDSTEYFRARGNDFVCAVAGQ
ncbi:hypothetical protein D3Z51_02730 [Clostridiaceae bacterium]|nr:hypothetical protein [Clostridiaceae bacterium]RKI18422.1 hypothetical protein D7V81_00860 [bacterium 1XD21-70]